MRPYIAANFTPYVLKQEAERALKPVDTFRECAKDCPEMVVVPPGEFWMGSPNGEGYPAEHPHHNVKIAKPFAVGKFEVTRDDWRPASRWGAAAECQWEMPARGRSGCR